VRLRLWAIVKAEHRFNDAFQLGRQLDGALVTSKGPARMRNPLQLNAERGIELGHGPGNNDRAARGVLVDHRKSIGMGKRTYCGQVRLLGAVLGAKFLPAESSSSAIAGCKRGNSCLQRLPCAPPHDYAYFQALRRIRWCQSTGARHRGTLTTLQRKSSHGLSPREGVESAD